MSVKNIAINIGTLFSGAFVARILSAISMFLIARQLGPPQFGVFISNLSLAKLLSVFFSLGLDNWMLRNGRKFHSQTIKHNSSACIFIKVYGGFAWLILIFLLSFILDSSTFPQQVFLLAGFSIWLEEIVSTLLSIFKTLLRNTITVRILIGWQILSLVSVALLLWLKQDEAQSFFLGRIIPLLITLIVSTLWVWREVGIQTKELHLIPIIKDSFSFAMSHGLALIYERADITIIGFWLGEYAAGLYGPAVTLTTTLFLIPHAIYEVMLPIGSETFREQPKDMRKLSFRLFAGNAFLGMLLSIGLVIFSKPLVWLIYGNAYQASGDILMLLSVILLFKSISFASAAILTSVNWQSRRVTVQLIVALFNIITNILIVNKYGIWGIAKVYVFSEAFLMIGYLIFQLRWLSLNNIPSLKNA